jgi:sulfur carrier protein
MSDVTHMAAIRVNGEAEPLVADTIAALLATRDISPQMKGVAVARNGSVVRRADWPTTPLAAGDVIEIVLARQGG